MRIIAIRPVALLCALCGAGVAGVALDRALLAQPAGITRTIMTRGDDPGSASHEAVMAVATIPGRTAAGRHRHAGIELAYVLEGSVVVEREGQAPVTVKAGEAFKNEAGIHDARNPGDQPVKILAVYLVEKGKPLAEPVKP